MPERNFIKLFRLNKEAVRYIINGLQPHMVPHRRITKIPQHLQILCVLHFLGHGSYQESISKGYHFSMSQPAVSRCINNICTVLTRVLLNEWIVFPQNERAVQRNKDLFFERYGFPGTIGVIDGTQIPIVAPPANHNIHPGAPYYNRKGFYSVNVQIIADANLRITNINARFPGSVHDAAIWRMSTINAHFENIFTNDALHYHLIGDEGYPLLPWLLIKYPGNYPENTPHGRYNRHLVRARIVIERVIGILKSRFRCLHQHRALHYNPIKAATIILSCAILHNISFAFNVPLVDGEYEYPGQNEMAVPNLDHYVQGARKRDQIVEEYFTQ